MSYFKPLFIPVLLVLFSSCSQPPKAKLGDSSVASTNIAQDIDVADFSDKMASLTDYLLLDVRTPEETSQAKIQDAMEIDFRQANFLDQVKLLSKARPVLVYCRSGNRSGQAMAKMHELGFLEVYNLKGGITAWQDSGRPVVSQE